METKRQMNIQNYIKSKFHRKRMLVLENNCELISGVCRLVIREELKQLLFSVYLEYKEFKDINK